VADTGFMPDAIRNLPTPTAWSQADDEAVEEQPPPTGAVHHRAPPQTAARGPIRTRRFCLGQGAALRRQLVGSVGVATEPGATARDVPPV
jgi:hypothetical protein